MCSVGDGKEAILIINDGIAVPFRAVRIKWLEKNFHYQKVRSFDGPM